MTLTAIRKAATAGTAALAVALACASAAAARAPSDDPVHEAKSTIEAANADWLPAMQSGDAVRIAAPYADDGMLIDPTGQVAKGRAGVEAFYRERLAKGPHIVGGGIRQTGIEAAAPDLIYEWGEGTLEATDKDGRRKTSTGRYLTVWRRGEDGAWKIVRNLVL